RTAIGERTQRRVAEHDIGRNPLLSRLLGTPRTERLEQIAVSLSDALDCGGLAGTRDRRATEDIAPQRHRLLAAEHGSGIRPRRQRAVFALRDEDAASQQLPHDRAPVLLAEVVADAIGREAIVPLLDDAVG